MLETAKNIGTYTVEYLRARDVTLDNNFINTSNWYSAAHPSYQYPRTGGPGQQSRGEEQYGTAGVQHESGAFRVPPTRRRRLYSSLQGYVSLADNPSAASPSVQDGNANVVAGKYYDRVTGVPYVVRFPVNSFGSGAISNFTALAGYNAMIYSSNSAYTTTSSRQYDPHYTSTKANYDGLQGLQGADPDCSAGADYRHSC